jgi:hypothetical protein
MKKEFLIFRGAVQPDADAQRFLDRLTAATGQGYKVEACGSAGPGGLFALVSKPAGAKLQAYGTLSRKEMDFVRALADCNINESATARELGVNRGTIDNRAARILTRTGLNPMNFYDLNELLYMEVEEDEQGTRKNPGSGD